MKLPDPPDGLILVPLPKACLLLTAREYVSGLRRGKWWKRRQRELARETATEGAHHGD